MEGKPLNRGIAVWLFIILPILGMLIFRKSFDLGLYGDDWQHLYILWREFFVFHTKSFFDIRSYIGPYFPESLYLGIISHFWGYNPPAYFISSFFFRFLANIAIYFLSYELTKSRLAAFISSFIFLITAAGLQTTDWVFNMNTYMGLWLLACSAILYLKIRLLHKINYRLYISFAITFAIALAIVPTRMHGATPFIVLTDIFLTFKDGHFKKNLNRYFFIRVFLAIGIFALLIHFKAFGEESYTNGRFNDSYKLVQALNQNGTYSWWLYFLGIMGHLFLPDNVDMTNGHSLKSVLFLSGFLSILAGYLSSYSILKSKKLTHYLPMIIFQLGWVIFLFYISKIDTQTSNGSYFSIYLGGQIIFWAVWLYLIARKKYSNLANTLIISIIWMISLTIIHWLFTPYFIIETTGRYMTMGSAGIALFMGALIALLLKNALNYDKDDTSKFNNSLFLGIPLLILFFFSLTNMQTTQNYFNFMYQTRNRELTEKTWKTLLTQVPKLDPKAVSVFYFTTDNPSSLYGVLTFGFFMRSGLEWRITNEALTPLPVTDYQQLLDIVKTGEPLQKIHGRKKEPLPLSRVYAFDFRQGELINITEQVRNKISQDLNLNQ